MADRRTKESQKETAEIFQKVIKQWTTRALEYMEKCAALERQIEAMKACPTCKFNDRRNNVEPCKSCDKQHSKYEWNGVINND